MLKRPLRDVYGKVENKFKEEALETKDYPKIPKE